MKQPDTAALRERLAGYTSEQDIQELDGLTEKISGQINGLHNLLDEIKDLREEMHGIHESLRHTLQRERTAFNALTAAKDSAENIVDGISNAIVKAEQHTVIKAEVSTADWKRLINGLPPTSKPKKKFGQDRVKSWPDTSVKTKASGFLPVGLYS